MCGFFSVATPTGGFLSLRQQSLRVEQRGDGCSQGIGHAILSGLRFGILEHCLHDDVYHVDKVQNRDTRFAIRHRSIATFFAQEKQGYDA